MGQNTAIRVYECPVETCLELLNGKWKPRILWHLHKNEVLRFNELRRKLPGVTPKMLTQQLRELEQDGMIERKIYPEVPPKVEYRFTSFGTTLRPVLDHIAHWGVEHNERIVALLQGEAVAD